ncbi:MAG: 50S ribosomal protein L15 [Patescibacteria group bacterium]
MTLSISTLAPAKGARSKSFRIGRGNASGRGTTAGKGTKGQRARSGGRNRLKLKGLKQMLLSFPKLRGFQSRYTKPVTLPIERVEAAFAANEKIDVRALKAKGLMTKSSLLAKVVGTNATKALTFVNVLASAPAKAAVEKAGGSFTMVKDKNEKAPSSKTSKKASR